MQAQVKVAGAWHPVLHTGFWVKIAGVWTQVKEGYTQVSSAWHLFHILAELVAIIAPGASGSGNYGYERRGTTYGLIDQDTLHNGNVVKAIRWDHLSSGAIDVALDGEGVPNTDATFASLELDWAGTFLRSAAGYNGTAGGYSVWSWSNNNSSSPTSGPVNTKLNAA